MTARHAIAERRWPDGMGGPLPPWEPLPGAAMTIDEAREAYDRGVVEMCQGREVIVQGGVAVVVVRQYAIPRRTPRKVTRTIFGRGRVW